MTNQLTYTIVEQVRTKHKGLAQRGGYPFELQVQNAYSDYLIATIGQALMERAHRLFRCFRPDFYDAEGYLKSYNPFVYDCVEVRLSRIAVDMMYRKAERDPELRLGKIDEVSAPVPAQMALF
jgi:hypothetical protein